LSRDLLSLVSTRLELAAYSYCFQRACSSAILLLLGELALLYRDRTPSPAPLGLGFEFLEVKGPLAFFSSTEGDALPSRSLLLAFHRG